MPDIKALPVLTEEELKHRQNKLFVDQIQDLDRAVDVLASAAYALSCWLIVIATLLLCFITAMCLRFGSLFTVHEIVAVSSLGVFSLYTLVTRVCSVIRMRDCFRTHSRKK